MLGFFVSPPPSIDEWLPENPLARFIVEAIERLDTSRLEQTYQGRGSAAYALRTQTVEPVFGIIKSVLGLRQFSLRELENTAGEWQLVCLLPPLLRPKFDGLLGFRFTRLVNLIFFQPNANDGSIPRTVLANR